MIRGYLFAEGPTDIAFLRRILPTDLLDEVELIDSGGSTGIPSLARTILVRRKKPVAVLMDSDSLEPDVIEERKESLEELIQAAEGSIPVKVVSTVPEIEAWFFESPEAIERILEYEVPPEWITLGKRDPRGVLQQLATNANKTWDTKKAIDDLDTPDIDRIRALPEVEELSRFLQEIRAASTPV